MTRDQILADFYSRVTSRKLWLALLAIGFAVMNYHSGALTAVEFQQAVMAAVLAYTAVEGASDVAAALRPPVTPELVTSLADELEKRRAERVSERLVEVSKKDAA